VKGTIQSLQDFGAFVDIGGVQALLPVSEIGRSRVDNIRNVLSVGQEVQAILLKIDWSQERLSLSTKALQADPWDQASDKYPEGSKHTGKVVRVANFGAFVSLEPGIDGLVHVSEFRTDSRYGASGEMTVKVGQTLSVQVLSVDRTQRRIALKPATTKEEDETTAKYVEGSKDDTTYNPFAAILKKK
jgi:small subunit ribosomal protein S1